MKRKLLNGIVFAGIACSVLLDSGCGGSKIVEQVKDKAESKVVSIADTALKMKDNTSYAKFMALRPGMSYKAAMATMIALPDSLSNIGSLANNVYGWKQDDGSVVVGFFLDDKLITKQYNTTKITLKQPFTVSQFNEIRNGDSYDTIKKKLNNQDGYISSVTVIPENKKKDAKELEQTTYTWRNPDGTAIEVEFTSMNIKAFVGFDGSKKRLVAPKAGTGSGGINSVKQPQGEATATNGAGSGATGKIFLGKWNGLKPGSSNTTTPNSITIKEANPQTGGYEVEITFYRLANAKGHANIDGNKLSINQGDIGGQKFRGTIEKTNKGIRLTVTESGFEYVKPGSVYEYIK